MKTLRALREETSSKKGEKSSRFFSHFKSASHPEHDIESKKEPVTFFAHFKSGSHPEHDIESSGGSKNINEALKKKTSNPSITPAGYDVSKSHEEAPASSLMHHMKMNSSMRTHYHDHTRNTGDYDNHPLEAVRRYTVASRTLNTTLHRKKKLSKFQDAQVKHLDAVTTDKKNALPRKIISYSGVSKKFGEKLDSVKVGEHLHSPAYISSSTDKGVAHEFSIGGGDDHITHMIAFHLPKGHTKARYVENISDNQGENEIIHARGQKFKKIGTTLEHSDYGSGKWTPGHGHGESGGFGGLARIKVHHLEPVDD